MKVIAGDTSFNNCTIGIVVAKWNSFITDKLLEGALNVLKTKGVTGQQVKVARCPGAFEIPFTARMLLPKVDGIVTLGAVIRGETPHFNYVCEAVTNGVLSLNMKNEKPVLFGILTTDTVQQATDRASQSSDFGNKGAEVALALLEMLSLKEKINKLEVEKA